MSGDARDFSNIETRAVIKVFFPARQDVDGNSGHSDKLVVMQLVGWLVS